MANIPSLLKAKIANFLEHRESYKKGKYNETQLRREYLDDTAALMMKQMDHFLSNSGLGSYIIPKPFLYASNWKLIRAELLPYITKIIDVSRVWSKVKLEMATFIIKKGRKSSKYKTGFR